MPKPIKVYREVTDFVVTLQPGVEDIYRVLGKDTCIVLRRTTAGNQLPEPPVYTTFGEAVTSGWLSSDRGTMEFSISLAEEEKRNFFGMLGVEWLPSKSTYGVRESTSLL
jgi:hypothetical protein